VENVLALSTGLARRPPPRLGGHGIGRTIHEEPSVPNSPDPGDPTVLHSGLVITVEPILGAGGRPLVLTA